MTQQNNLDHYQQVQTEMVSRALAQWRPFVTDQVAVITGGARGIGKVLAQGLLEAGAKVVCADVTWKDADEFRDRLDSSGRGLGLEMDVTSDESVRAAYDAVLDRFGRVDTLINNAGLVSETLFAPKGKVPTLETTDQDWQRMFGVNVFGTVRVIQTFVKAMLDQGNGSIVNVVSSGVLMESVGGGYFATRPWTTEMPYQASKASLTTLTFYLAEELKRTGIAVNAFMPGHTRASWFDDTARAISSEGRIYALRPMAPQHVLPLVLFLAAQASSQSGEPATGRLYHVPDWNYDHGYGGLQSWGDYDLPEDIEAGYRELEAAMPDYWRSGLARARFDAERVAYAAGMDKIKSAQEGAR
ncbi:SDR family NAD(P)-dependent oxidoreductase [Sphaerimonospora cavernae]|uniref:SDR family NAD(P)-dependent oxidoreductase n=1 Tax=Sphaerimonospora cavernae TaxID=1740611 RepID=A0ABV6U2T6_9ACTN